MKDQKAPDRSFDPWTSSASQAEHYARERRPGEPDPMAQWVAASEVTRARESVLRDDGGVEVMRCLALCLSNALTPPRWLGDAYIQRHERISAAEVATWDEAFGRPWPKRTRLADVRARRRLKARVHAAACDLALDEPETPINRAFFDRIGAMKGIHRSGSVVEGAYYEALRDGRLNVAMLRPKRSPGPPLSDGSPRIDRLLHGP